MVYSFPVFYLPRQVIFVKIIFFVIIIPPFLDFVDLILALFQPFEKGWAKTFPLFEKSGAKTFKKIIYLICE